MSEGRLEFEDFYLLGLMLGETGEHLSTSFSYREFATDVFSTQAVRKSLDRLVRWGLATDDEMRVPGSRKTERMIMLTPSGLAFCLRNELTVLKAMMDGGPLEGVKLTKDAFKRLNELEFAADPVSLFALEGELPENDIWSVENLLAQASDRVVPFNHNSVEFKNFVGSIEGSIDALDESNALEPEFKSAFVSMLETGLELLRKGSKAALGALRFLIFDRLKEAYSSAMEESLKLVIQGALLTGFLWLAGFI